MRGGSWGQQVPEQSLRPRGLSALLQRLGWPFLQDLRGRWLLSTTLTPCPSHQPLLWGRLYQGRKWLLVHGLQTPLLVKGQRNIAFPQQRCQRKEKSGFVPNHKNRIMTIPGRSTFSKFQRQTNAGVLSAPHGKNDGPKFLFECSW